MFEKHYVGLDLTKFENGGKTRPISRVTLNVDDETVLTAGDDTGLELTADCPHATQEMVDAILASVRGYRYQMYKANAINIDPAAELGDGITANGVYSVISRLDDDGSGYPDASAPGEEEMEDEFPTSGPLTQAFNRKIASAKSQILKLADEIRLVVEYVGNVRAELSLKVGRNENNQIVSMLNASADQINIKGNRFVLDSTNFKVTADGTLTVSKGVFDQITISGSIFGGSLKEATGSLDGVTGSYLGSINSGGTFSGGLSSVTGSYRGSVYGSYGGILSSCNIGGTTLKGEGNGYFRAYTSGVGIYDPREIAVMCSGATPVATFTNALFSVSNVKCNGDLTVTGSKNRVIGTSHFGARCLNAFETPLPTFSDYGTARLDKNGYCCLAIDAIFAETVNPEYLPTVFLTKYGQGDIWVAEVEADTVTVRGTPGLLFAWETRFAQANASIQRLQELGFDQLDRTGEADFEGEANVELEHSAVDYAQEGYEYYTDFERSIEAA